MSSGPIDLGRERRRREAARSAASFVGVQTVRMDPRLRDQLGRIRRFFPDASPEALIRLAVGQMLGRLLLLDAEYDPQAIEQLKELAGAYELPSR